MVRALLIVTMAGCSSRPSIEIFFPNQIALDATRRVRIELHDPTGERCTSFAELVAEEKSPLGSESKSADIAAPFQEIDVEDVPSSAQVVFAWAFASPDRDEPPFLAGCTDHYDPRGDEGEAENVPLVLEHISYPTLTIRAASGNRQAARPGETLPQPLRVRGEATAGGRTFAVPGLEVVFRTDRPVALSNGTVEQPTLTSAEGIAETTVMLPLEPGTSSVRATSPLVEHVEVTFTVSALEELRLQTRTIAVPFDATPVALAAGEIDGAGVDLIAVGSSNGATRLMVVDRPLANPVSLPVPQDLGVAPVGVAVFGTEIAVANARVAARENAEVRLLRFAAGAIALENSYVLTGSNAVGLTSFARLDGYDSLAIATTGRSRDSQTCPTNQPPCGGCPAGECCGGENLCVANDGVVVLLSPDPARPGLLLEEGRCEEPVTNCGRNGCCLDAVVACEVDDCGCEIPSRVRLGGCRGPLNPRAIAAAPLRAPAARELLVSTEAGIHRLDQSPSGISDSGTFLLSSNVTAVVSSEIDPELDGTADVAWIEIGACGRGASIDVLCPIAAEVAEPRGCLGLILTEQSGPVPDLNPPVLGSCRRHQLAHMPEQICVARIDDDQHPDLVISTPADDRILVFAGDGVGGILEPPQQLEIPGGPMLCADLDGDGREEIVVADRAQPGRFLLMSF